MLKLVQREIMKTPEKEFSYALNVMIVALHAAVLQIVTVPNVKKVIT